MWTSNAQAQGPQASTSRNLRGAIDVLLFRYERPSGCAAPVDAENAIFVLGEGGWVSCPSGAAIVAERSCGAGLMLAG